MEDHINILVEIGLMQSGSLTQIATLLFDKCYFKKLCKRKTIF